MNSEYAAKTPLHGKLCRIALAATLIATAIPTAILSAEQAYAASLPTRLVNGSFSYPAASQLPGFQAIAKNDCYISPSTGQRWFTMMEGSVWSSINNWDRSKFGWVSDEPYRSAADTGTSVALPAGRVQINFDDTTQAPYGEIVVDSEDAAIYQDIATTVGGLYKWSLKHCSHASTYDDSMRVMIGPVGSMTAQNARRTSSNGYGDQVGSVGTLIKTHNAPNSTKENQSYSASWETYAGEYIATSTVTRFTYKSVVAIDPGSGNNIDDVSFAKYDPLLYNLNGGTASGLATTLAQAQANNYAGYSQEGATKALTSIKPTRTGYTFLGWAKSKITDVASKAAYDNIKSSLVNSITIAAGTNTVYAVWGKNPTVTFKNGEPTPSTLKTQTVTFGAGATAPSAPTRTGYTFTEWDRAYNAIYENTTVNAKWRANTYTIAFDANGGAGTMDNQTMAYDQTEELAANLFNSSTSTWQRWNTRPDGTGSTFTDKQSVSNLTTQDGTTVTLYAQWATNPTITFKDGWGNTLKEETVVAGSSGTPPEEPKKPGYTFQGWDGSYETVTNDTTIYAEWQRNPYTVSFDGNGGEGSMDDLQMEFDRAKKLPRCAFQKMGYQFAGWSAEEEDAKRTFKDEETVVNLSEEANATVVLQACWLPRNYTVSFDANGAMGTMDDLQASLNENIKLPPCSFTFPGKGFRGWALEKNGAISYPDAAPADSLLTGEEDHITLFAIWEEDAPVLITYQPDNPAQTSVTRDADEVAPLSGKATGSKAITEKGYSFDAWVDAEGKIASTTAAMLPARNSKGLYEAGSFTAMSHPITYTIRYDSNGGSGSMPRTQCTYGEPATIASNEFAFEGKRFTGWCADLSGHGRTLAEGESALNLASENGAEITLYALWENTPVQPDVNTPESTGESNSDTAFKPQPEESGIANINTAEQKENEEQFAHSKQIFLNSELTDPSDALISTGYEEGKSNSNASATIGTAYDKTGDTFRWVGVAFAVLAISAAAGTCMGLRAHRKNGPRSEDV